MFGRAGKMPRGKFFSPWENNGLEDDPLREYSTDLAVLKD
jgi:hypothetical protein